MPPKEIYVEGIRYVPDDIYEKVRYLKQRAEEIYISDHTDVEVIYLINNLIEMLPNEI